MYLSTTSMNGINKMTPKNKTQINDILFRHHERKVKVISLIKCRTKGIQSIPAVRFVSRVLNYASNKILFCVRYKALPSQARNFSKHCRVIFHCINQPAYVDRSYQL